MSCKLSVDGFEWVKKASQFNKGFIKSYNEYSEVSEDFFHFEKKELKFVCILCVMKVCVQFETYKSIQL